ncbi:unnamed protein product, partial [Nesidiocoris tenuis]
MPGAALITNVSEQELCGRRAAEAARARDSANRRSLDFIVRRSESGVSYARHGGVRMRPVRRR